MNDASGHFEVIDLGRCGYQPTLERQHDLLARVQAQPALSYLLLVEHDPPVITLGRRSRDDEVLSSPDQLAAEGIEVHRCTRGGQTTYHGPGQLVAYPIVSLRRLGLTLRGYVHALEAAVIATLADLGVASERHAGMTGVWAGEGKIAAIGVAVEKWTTWHGLAMNVSTDLRHFGAIVPCGQAGAAVTSVKQILGAAPEMAEVKRALTGRIKEIAKCELRVADSMSPGVVASHEYRDGLRWSEHGGKQGAVVQTDTSAENGCVTGPGFSRGSKAAPPHSPPPRGQSENLPTTFPAGEGLGVGARSIPRLKPGPDTQRIQSPVPVWVTAPQRPPCHPESAEHCDKAAFELPGRKPEWLKRSLAGGSHVASTQRLLDALGLATVCDSAKCPNRCECFDRQVATFLILGDRCTRSCRFCAVAKGEVLPPRADEPAAVAQAAEAMGLRHVVVTSVTRDDLPDGGSGHFAATIFAIHARLPEATVEVLTPDFLGQTQALETVLAARPDVFNHNVEAVGRLYGVVRPEADYRRSLDVLALAARSGVCTKSGLMVGLGEQPGEVLDVLADLRAAGCQIVTIGQYLQPSPAQLPVARYVAPTEFDAWRQEGLRMGFAMVHAGPFVRSSYRAGEIHGIVMGRLG